MPPTGNTNNAGAICCYSIHTIALRAALISRAFVFCISSRRATYLAICPSTNGNTDSTNICSISNSNYRNSSKFRNILSYSLAHWAKIGQESGYNNSAARSRYGPRLASAISGEFSLTRRPQDLRECCWLASSPHFQSYFLSKTE